MDSWQLQEAKARLSELVKRAASQGPQEITVRGKGEAVVLSRSDYERLKRHKPSFLQFMRRSPLVGVRVEFERDRSLTRPVRL
jgi:antitoxin Phd